MVIDTAWKGAGFALGAYLITLVMALLVVGMIKIMWAAIHRRHTVTATKHPNKPEEGK